MEDLLEENLECKVLCVTEHWKTTTQLENYGIVGYNLITSFCRKEENRHGGSAIYANKNIQCITRKDINSVSVEGIFECCGCECRIQNKRIIVICLYRPPNGNINDFLSRIESVLSICMEGGSIVICAGDFNLDFLSTNKKVLELLSIINSFNMKHVIKEHTRVTAASRTCIDNILTNFNGNYITQVLQSHISDHTAQKLVIYLDAKTNHFIEKRSFSEINKKRFKAKLLDRDWSSLYMVERTQVNDQWNCFMNIILTDFNECFPTIKLPSKNLNKTKNRQKTPEILECKRQLDLLYVLKNVNNTYRYMYTKKKKEYDTLLLDSKKINYANRLRSSDNKTKCAWAVVKEITGKNKTNDFKLEGDMTNVSNDFNNLFTNMSTRLLGQLNDVPFSTNIQRNHDSMSIKLVDSKEILNIVKNLKNKFSCGSDEISTSIIKYIITAIVQPIVYIFNNSLRFGIFPDKLKLALIVPVFKKGDETKLDNYRPISLLPSFSKILERVMCDRIMEFLLAHDILNDVQHAYLKGRSTQTAMFRFTEEILKALERGVIPLGLFLDLSKAYDTLNYNILIQKLELYGIKETALRWIISYLSGRQQKVIMGKGSRRVSSDQTEIGLGVPQGSVIGPLLFIVYINDITELCSVNSNCIITNYADDTNLLVTAMSLPTLIKRSQLLMRDAAEWFTKNKLILNNSKTSIILFKTKRSTLQEPDSINIINSNIELKQSTRFLGMVLDSNLTWEEHIEYVAAQVK